MLLLEGRLRPAFQSIAHFRFGGDPVLELVSGLEVAVLRL
jgi:hypothetical protein